MFLVAAPLAHVADRLLSEEDLAAHVATTTGGHVLDRLLAEHSHQDAMTTGARGQDLREGTGIGISTIRTHAPRVPAKGLHCPESAMCHQPGVAGCALQSVQVGMKNLGRELTGEF